MSRRTMVLNPNFVSISREALYLLESNLHDQITDMMSIFALVSQSLRTGEPMHQILPTTLLDRLFYHHSHDIMVAKETDQEPASYVDRATSIEFLYFSSGITSMSQVIKVRIVFFILPTEGHSVDTNLNSVLG